MITTIDPMADSAGGSVPKFASSLSVRAESASAAKEAADRATERLGGVSPDLAFAFITAPHVDRASEIASMLTRRLGVRHLVLMSASGVIAGSVEVESGPGISLMLASLPGAVVKPFLLQELPRVPAEPTEEWRRDIFAPAMHITPEHSGTLILADPFSVPLVRTLPAMSAASRGRPVTGALASSADGPGRNVIALNDQVMTSGGLGLSFAGTLTLDGVISQGCKPIGPTMLVTKAQGNVILELSGKRAIETLRDALRGLPPKNRTELTRGMLLGRVINEYKERFGQGDFLIRGVKAIEGESGAIISDDFFRVGQTVQLHVRDAESARGDLEMVLDAQKLGTRPVGGLVFSSQRRGVKLFGQPSVDAAAIGRAFRPVEAGVQQAKSGEQIDVGQANMPLAGAFSLGEIGPVGNASYLHSMTAGLTLFRRGRPA